MGYNIDVYDVSISKQKKPRFCKQMWRKLIIHHNQDWNVLAK